MKSYSQKNFFRSIFIIGFSFLISFLFSCKEKKDGELTKQISFPEKEYVLKIGEEKQLSLIGAEGLKGIEWSSSNEKVASVELGKVKALSLGETTITASVLKQKASVVIKVIQSDKPHSFKPYLQIEGGVLKALPELLLPFDATKKQIEEKEREFGSVFEGESSGFLNFKTNDPNGYNPMRKYQMGAKGMLRLAVVAKLNLFFDGDELNDNLQLLLAKSNFKVTNQTKEISYSNGSLLYIFIPYPDKGFCVVMLAKDVESGEVSFNEKAQDFPVLDVELEGKTDADIRALVEEKERAMGRVWDERYSKIYQGVAFSAPKVDYGKYVFQVVCYKGGAKDKAGITALSYAIVNEKMLDSKPVLDYFARYGFKDFSWLSAGEMKISKMQNKEKGWIVNGAIAASGKMGMFSFQKISSGTKPDPKPDPTPKREKFYMPVLDAIGQSISLESAFVKEEQARGFTVEYIEKKADFPAQIVVTLPRDKTVGGMSSFFYSPKSKDVDATVVEEISIMFHGKKNTTPSYNHNGTDDPELKSFLEANGFKFEKSERSFALITFYYNKEKDLTLTIFDSSSAILALINKGRNIF